MGKEIVSIGDSIGDYDCGIINTWGGGVVSWWEDYIRSEIGRCNDYWRDTILKIEEDA